MNLIQTYEVDLIQVHDGDTITVNIHVGFGITLEKQRFRLARINAPELLIPVTRKPNPPGTESKEYLQNLLTGKFLTIKTASKKEKFGRWLCELQYKDPNSKNSYPDIDVVNVNDDLLKNGYASVYLGNSIFGSSDKEFMEEIDK